MASRYKTIPVEDSLNTTQAFQSPTHNYKTTKKIHMNYVPNGRSQGTDCLIMAQSAHFSW